MKKLTLLMLCLSLLLCACAGKQSAQQEMTKPTISETTQPQTVTATAPTPETTAAAETTLPVQTMPPRVPGPEMLEGNAATIENVSVEYTGDLPKSIKASSTYSVCGFKEEFVLNDSQVYALIHFTVTNLTGQEMKVTDIHDDFLVELVYDDQYVYSPDADAWCFFQSGSQTAVVQDNASIGKLTLAPLVTKDVAVYIPCAKELSTDQEKNLSVIFSLNYSGYESLEFVIR